MKLVFTKENWETIDYKISMADDLIAKRLLIEMSKSEVVCMLGDEFNDINSNRWSYYLGTWGSWIGLKKYRLIIYFDDNHKVNRVIRK